MNPIIETAAEAVRRLARSTRGPVAGTPDINAMAAQAALASLAQHRDDIARELALASGDGWVFDLPPEYQEQDIVAAPLVRKYLDLTDAVLALFTEGAE